MFSLPLTFKSVHEQVKARVFSLVEIKIKNLRAIQSVVLEENFLIFLGSIEEFENFLLETLNCPWTVVSNCVQGTIRHLDDGKEILLKKIKDTEKELNEIEDNQRVLELFGNEIDM